MKTQFIQRYFAPDVSVGAQLVLDAGGAFTTMKEFKKELRQAKEDLLNIQHTFGATSKEALEAAKKVAQFEDALKDASETAKLFDPGNKFQVLGNAVRGLVGGFAALQGALALAGVESDDLQKSLLKVQGALALTEGLNVIADVAKDFQRLGSVLMQTFGKSGLIGIAIAGVALLGASLAGVFDGPSVKVKELRNSIKELGKAEADATLEVLKTKNAFKQAELGIISKKAALEVYNNGIGKTVGFAKDLNAAEKLTADNAQNYIKVQGLKAQANYILSKSAELSANAMLAEQALAKEIAENPGIKVFGADKIFADRFATQKKDAADLLSLIDGINKQIAEASKGFKEVGAPAPTKDKTDKKAEDEQRKSVERAEFQLKTERDFTEKYIEELLKRGAAEEAAAARKAQAIGLGRDLSINAAADIIKANQAQSESARISAAIEEEAARNRITAANAIGGALGALSELIGKQTAAGKALAIAQAVINTWVGVSEVLRAKSVLPEPLATISKIANVAAIVATGLNAVKNIGKAQVPGASGGGGTAGGSLQTAAPLQPRSPLATNTLLNQQQLNQLGNATVRAFVVESDMASGAERARRLNRAARL